MVTTNPVLHEEVSMSGTEKTKAHAEQAKGKAEEAMGHTDQANGNARHATPRHGRHQGHLPPLDVRPRSPLCRVVQ
ncbi:hypothetical protein ACIQK6_42625 [Streptomyces sp. NPDC091682]|uniref:hypothetical protein n=1 Tax=Streptomyces sp. NPDC091682 TaxID=3366005 RepID=UPI0038197EEC